MYDIMFIDDDESLRAHLKSMIDWNGIPIRLVCEAGDSETAWEMFMQYRPMILLTDINIPIISGLELAKKISAVDQDVRFIVITSYTDFDYVQEAVTLGAVELLRKPLSESSVNACLLYTSSFDIFLLHGHHSSLPVFKPDTWI